MIRAIDTMNFELKFSSSKGEFTINVDFVALLDTARIPFTFLVPQESAVTTTDRDAFAQISRCLGSSPLGFSGETTDGMLVEANGTRWILFGRKEVARDEEGGGLEREVLRVKARMIGGHALTGMVRPQSLVAGGQSVFLVKKVRSALDDHQVKGRKKRRMMLPEATMDEQTRSSATPSIEPGLHPPPPEASTKEIASSPSVSKEATGFENDAFPETLSHSVPRGELKASDPNILDKGLKDRLKKMIITLLSLQGISKRDVAFKDLYQHTLQASSFALRLVSKDPVLQWEAQAMSINQTLIKIFLGPAYKEDR